MACKHQDLDNQFYSRIESDFGEGFGVVNISNGGSVSQGVLACYRPHRGNGMPFTIQQRFAKSVSIKTKKRDASTVADDERVAWPMSEHSQMSMHGALLSTIERSHASTQPIVVKTYRSLVVAAQAVSEKAQQRCDRQLVFPNTVMGRQGLYGNDSLCSLVYSLREDNLKKRNCSTSSSSTNHCYCGVIFRFCVSLEFFPARDLC